MKTTIASTLMAAILFCSFYISSCADSSGSKNEASSKTGSSAEPTNEDIVKQGEHLVTTMGCNDCHSPKKMGANGPEIIQERMLSGFPSDRPVARFDTKITQSGFSIFYPDLTAAAGPWGMSFAANLTPDSTGLGNWTEEQFKTAITKGKYKGLENNRMLMPPMPWFNYTALSDKEVSSIFAYLKSIKPVRNVVPQPIAPGKL
jgi:mono/diheme cytochrome c family protein